ncbi:hypothetical protein [Streptomyces sp. Wb2n-11]|uniref:hypothetical protein n=1 Tax=Streptomyces sp. Wb2n-11 TaxID=1030533 RepID=UPI000A9D0E07|nr:hypothetical protein [Streptomyces sp. Wb2n-11]
MNRADLAEMLNEQTTACEPAKAALLDGGGFIIWDGNIPGQQLASIYAARHRRARKRGTETIALSTTVDILTQYGTAPLRIDCISTRDRTRTFTPFLTEDAGAVLACTGVRRVDP